MINPYARWYLINSSFSCVLRCVTDIVNVRVGFVRIIRTERFEIIAKPILCFNYISIIDIVKNN